MKKLLIVSLLLLAFSVPASALGGDTGFGMSWSSAIGTGDTGDFISGFQARDARKLDRVVVLEREQVTALSEQEDPGGQRQERCHERNSVHRYS